MESDHKIAFCEIGEVRGGKEGNGGKLLFKLGINEHGLLILIKPKGDECTYIIPIELLIAKLIENIDIFSERNLGYLDEIKE